MMSIRKIKLREYTTHPKITLLELKEAMIRYYYPTMDDEEIKHQMERELIITKIKNGYNNIYTIYFSVNGSPPKGECVFLKQFVGGEHIRGMLIFIGNAKISKSIHGIEITDLNLKDELL